MSEQQTLEGFSQKTIPLSELTSDFRAWNRCLLDWDIEYQGYEREGEGEPGYVDFSVRVEIREALVMAKNPQTHKKTERPGYKLTVTQGMSFNGLVIDPQIVHEESFQIDQLGKAFDAFQEELLQIQAWIEIAESRARLIPNQNDVFECLQCGWVTDIWSDDLMCQGCGRRYWSQRLWSRGSETSQDGAEGGDCH